MILGKIDPDNIAGGTIRLSVRLATEAVARDVGARLSMDAEAAAFGICEVVGENMANAARIDAVENGKNISDNVMIAFGGAAPLHGARLCEKLGIDQCLIPQSAGVGSASIAREVMTPGDMIHGPAVVVERETSTVITSPFDCVMQADGAPLLRRKGTK